LGGVLGEFRSSIRVETGDPDPEMTTPSVLAALNSYQKGLKRLQRPLAEHLALLE
jgi:hypothetical protein